MKKVTIRLVSLTAIVLFLVAVQSHAQLIAPSASPAAHVSQVVGFTKISMDYSSPAVKGRKVFGELEKYGVTWRAGANAPTTIEFSTPVRIGDKNVGAGKYTLFITPQASGDWTIHLNSKGNAVYAYTKDGKVDEAALANDDIVAVKASPVMDNEVQERLSYTISAGNNKVAKVTMAWDKVRLSFMVDTQVDQKMEGFKSIF
nr:DUF2911 domain-containing protein [Cytophagales bacterium]